MADRFAFNAVPIRRVNDLIADPLSARMTPTERRVAHVYGEFLAADDVEPEDDIFTLGGDSLVAVRIILELEQIFQMPIPPDILLDVQSVRGVAGWIDRRRKPGAA